MFQVLTAHCKMQKYLCMFLIMNQIEVTEKIARVPLPIITYLRRKVPGTFSMTLQYRGNTCP